MHFIVDEHPGLRPPGFAHSLYACLVTPRPIGWMTTISAAGVLNLAPFSFFNLIASDPLCCMYCVNGAHVAGGPKDSLANVREVGEFVFNLCTAELGPAMNLTAANSPRDGAAPCGGLSCCGWFCRQPRPVRGAFSTG